MKQILFLFIAIIGLFACSDDDTAFDVMPSKDFIRSIKSLPGGALIRYNFPVDKDVFALNVRYRDAHNQDVLKVSEYGCDSLILDGFNEAKQGITARISFSDRKGKESDAMEITFDTESSATYTFFDEAEVLPSWGGFDVIYKAPEQVSGTVHVFYIGTNPVTKELDTLLLKSSPIMKGGDTLSFPLKQERSENTVVVRTEDYRGYRVRQKVWEHVESYIAEKMDPKDFDFNDFGLSVENQGEVTGVKYLFDGDTKGEQRMISKIDFETFTYVAGPKAVKKPFIIDMREEKIPAKVRIYGILWTGEWFSSDVYGDTGELAWLWKGACHNKLPCAFSVYGSNESDPDASSWVKLGAFEQDPDLAVEDQWCYYCIRSWDFNFSTIELLREADPAYCEVVIPASATKYRYLKLVVDDVFNSFRTQVEGDNREEYVTMNELEIYVKKEL